MSLLPIIAAFVVAGALGSLTDWLFMGVLFHDAYNAHPEIWRPGIRDGADKGAIIVSSVLGFVITGAVVGLCVFAGVHSIAGGLAVGVLAWLAGPPTVIVINGLFIKIDPRITLAHCLGYGARIVLAGLAAGVALGPLAGR
jgi:hypothetical protein